MPSTFMGISSTIIFISILIAIIWVFVEVKRLKHKVMAMALIGLIIFSYLSFFAVFNDNKADLKTPSGLLEASKIYFSWLISIFENLKTLTANAIHLDWNPDKEQLQNSRYRE